VYPDGSHGPISERSLADRRIETVLEAVCSLVEHVSRGEQPTRVGIGIPGFVHQGVVLASPNFPQWSEVPVQALLTAKLGSIVRVENDANAATLGAWRALAKPQDLVLLTLGTGVGGGVVTGGRLLRGSRGTGAELGHIYVGGEARCGCGGRGCLETWVSTVGLAARHGVESGQELVQRAVAGDSGALEEAGRALGRGLATLVNVFNPSIVVLAGGLTAAKQWLGPPAEAILRRDAIPANAKQVEIRWAGRADAWAISGAALDG
jgi:glucokinase